MDRQRSHRHDSSFEARPEATSRAAPSVEDEQSTVAAAAALSAVQLKEAAGGGSATLAAAERGLAAPGAAYPHREAIEASFGRPVTATAVTGAREACDDMGAQAYASGNRVAFRDASPDLHTAAHEAAHTMQQAAGVHLKGGVGEAGDAYEQQADRAADLVVAGQSAAHLFSDVGHAVAPASGAVQKKPAADDQAAIASIRAAQHEIDKLSASLKSADWGSISGLEPLTRAARHMEHARAALDVNSGPELAAAYRSYRYALQQCEEMGGRLRDAPSTVSYLFTVLWVEDEKYWAKELNLEAQPSKKDFKTTITGKDKGASTIDKSAAEALNLLAVEARETFDLLAEGKDRDMIVGGARANMHTREAEYAIWVIEQLDDKQRDGLKDEIEAASQPLAAIRHWLYNRTGTKAAIAKFTAAEGAANKLRATVKLGTLEKMPVPDFFPAGEEAEATEERGKLDSALLDYATEIQQTWAKALTDGVQDWFELAQKKDQEKPNFMRNLLGFAATALLGNFGGMFAKQALSKMKDAFKPDTIDALSGSVSDVAQAVAGPMLAAGEGEAKDDAAELKSLQFMRGALNQGIGLMITKHVTDLTAKKDERNLTTDEVRKAIAKLKGTSTGAQKQATLDAAAQWSRYVAQAALRKARKEGDESKDPGKDADAVATDVTDLRDDYFGTPREVPAGTFTKKTVWDNNRKGTAGVLRVEIKHQHRQKNWVRDIPNDPPELMKVDLNGMNSEMAKLVCEKGGNILGKIPVPKEILIRHYHFGSIGNYNTETSLIAVDETGKVTDYVDDGADFGMSGHMWWTLIKDFDVSGKID